MASRPRSAPAATEPEALRPPLQNRSPRPRLPPPPTPAPEARPPPLQNRSRASLERVLEAGQKLLEEEGWEGFTVQEVSRRAKVSIGSIYARAPSKEALIYAIYDRAVDHIAEENA